MNRLHRSTTGPRFTGVRATAGRHLVGALVCAAALGACGGGNDNEATVQPPPADTASGLLAATGSLRANEEVARLLVAYLQEAFDNAPGGVASKTMGAFAPGIDHGMAETFDCPGGGTASFQPSGAEAGSYVYSACVIEGVTYTGTGVVLLTLQGGELHRYLINQFDITVVAGGQAHALDGHVECEAVDDGLGSSRESAQHIVGPLLCVGHHVGQAYGADLQWQDGVMRGSMQWPIDGDRWNAYAWDVSAQGGSAYVAAGSGTAAIRRLGASAHEVTISAEGRTVTFRVAPQ